MFSDLKFILFMYAATVMCYGSVHANSYRQLNTAIQRIDELMVAQANYFNFDLANAPITYVDRAAFVVENLRKKAIQFEELDNMVYNKCVAYGIEVYGLEFVGTRLRRLLNYLDERDKHQKNVISKSHLEAENCGHQVYELEQKLHEVNNSLGQTVGMQNVKIAALEKERDKLLAKVNKNSPAIHGRTGAISGVENCTSNTGNQAVERGETKKQVIFVGFPEFNQQNTEKSHTVSETSTKKTVLIVGFPELNLSVTETTPSSSETSNVPLNTNSSISSVVNDYITPNTSSVTNSNCENNITLDKIIEDKGYAYGIQFRDSEDTSIRLQKLINYFDNRERHQSEIVKKLRENLNRCE